MNSDHTAPKGCIRRFRLAKFNSNYFTRTLPKLYRRYQQHGPPSHCRRRSSLRKSQASQGELLSTPESTSAWHHADCSSFRRLLRKRRAAFCAVRTVWNTTIQMTSRFSIESHMTPALPYADITTAVPLIFESSQLTLRRLNFRLGSSGSEQLLGLSQSSRHWYWRQPSAVSAIWSKTLSLKPMFLENSLGDSNGASTALWFLAIPVSSARLHQWTFGSGWKELCGLQLVEN